jgi:rhamnulokinase
MPNTLRELAGRAGAQPQTDAEILRCAFDSLARRYSQVLRDLEEILGRRIESIYIVGGGVQNQWLCQLTADACDRMVVAGPSEATAIGNALIQATRFGLVADVAQARQWLAAQLPQVVYHPQQPQLWRERLL